MAQEARMSARASLMTKPPSPVPALRVPSLPTCALAAPSDADHDDSVSGIMHPVISPRLGSTTARRQEHSRNGRNRQGLSMGCVRAPSYRPYVSCRSHQRALSSPSGSKAEQSRTVRQITLQLTGTPLLKAISGYRVLHT